MWDFWPFAAIHRKLDDLARTLAQVVRAQSDQATIVAAIFSRLGVIMADVRESFAKVDEKLNRVITETGETATQVKALRDEIADLKNRIPSMTTDEIVSKLTDYDQVLGGIGDRLDALQDHPAPEPDPEPEDGR